MLLLSYGFMKNNDLFIQKDGFTYPGNQALSRENDLRKRTGQTVIFSRHQAAALVQVTSQLEVATVCGGRFAPSAEQKRPAGRLDAVSLLTLAGQRERKLPQTCGKQLLLIFIFLLKNWQKLIRQVHGGLLAVLGQPQPHVDLQLCKDLTDCTSRSLQGQSMFSPL